MAGPPGYRNPLIGHNPNPPVKAPKGPTGPIGTPVDPSAGGRSNNIINAKAKAAAKAAAKGKKSKVPVTPTTPVDTTGTTPVVPTGTPEDTALANTNIPISPGYGPVNNGGTDLAGQFDAGQYAKGLSGMQYDPQIIQVAGRIKGIINALPGSIDSLHKAFANLQARAQAPVTQGVLGGNTGASSEAYGAATAANANAASAAQANSAASREADWNTRIRLMSDANVNDLRGQLGGLTQAKSDAQVGYYNQGIKTKSDLVAQAINNINNIRASNDAQAMVEGNLQQQGARTTAMQLQNTGTALQNSYLPIQLQQNATTANQGIEQGNISLAQAKTTLKTNNPGKNLATALSAGGPAAIQSLTSLIVPSGGLTQNANGFTHVNGDPNIWLKNGVAQIMRTLPKSSRANVTKFVQQQISQVISPAGGWTMNKNGKFVRPK